MSAWVRNPEAVSFWCVQGLPSYLEWKHHTAFYQIIAHYPHCKLEPVLFLVFLNSLSSVQLNENRLMWQIHIQTHSAHTVQSHACTQMKSHDCIYRSKTRPSCLSNESNLLDFWLNVVSVVGCGCSFSYIKDLEWFQAMRVAVKLNSVHFPKGNGAQPPTLKC